ncbi:hypothetical protein BC828DRAFT_379358 [Blastocladiella britannica]|nr:hypothetical protein BC828DRAFT_379358 [Blastocladiella britannica]
MLSFTIPAGSTAHQVPLIRLSPAPKHREALSARLARAEAARTQRLAQRSAAARERVSHAQAVAMHHHQAILAENALRALALNANLDASSQRRAAYLLARRTSAALRRRQKRQQPISVAFRTAVDAFMALDLVTVNAASASLDDLADRLCDDHTLAVTRRLLNEIALLSDCDGNPFDAKTFLAALPLVMFPDQVLGTGNELDQELLDASAAVLDAFSPILHSSDPSASQAQAIVCTYSSYTAAFDAWKRASQQILVDELVAHHLEVDRMWVAARDRFAALVRDESGDDGASEATRRAAREYLDGLRVRQQMIRNRLIRLDPESQQRLRIARENAGVAAFDLARDDPESLLGPGLSALSSGSSRSSGRGGVAEGVVEGKYSSVPAEAGQHMYHVSDIAAAHEMYFEVGPADDNAPSGKEQMVVAAIRQAFRTRAESADSDAWFVDGLRDLRKALESARLSEQFDGMVDMDWVQEQDSVSSDDKLNLLARVHGLLRASCAPARDESLRRLAVDATQAQSLPALLYGLIDAAWDLSRDTTADRRARMRPTLAPVLMHMEQSHFGAALAQGNIPRDLPLTRAWLSRAATSLPAGSKHRVIWEAAFTNLLVSPPMDSVPETFPFEATRLGQITERLHRAVLVAALVSHAKARVDGPIPELVRAADGTAAAAKQLFAILSDSTTMTELHVRLESAMGNGSAVLVRRCVAKTDPVAKLLMRRVESILRAAIAPGAAAAPSFKGLEAVAGPLADIVAVVIRLAAHNRLVYAQWYNRVLDELHVTPPPA